MTPISIVVPARNSSHTIEACLGSILRHVPAGAAQVVVVDNGSTDGTAEVARRFPVDVVSAAGFVSGARNVGARLAHHPLLAFVDSDCVIRPGWYEAIVDVLADERIGVTGLRHELRDAPTWCELAWTEAHVGHAPVVQRDVPYIPAGNFATRRSVFVQAGGFDEALETGEDPDLCARIAARKYRIVQDPRIRCAHLGEPRTLGDVFRRERWHGRGARFRYGDGRLAVTTVTTAVFAATLVAAAAGLAFAASVQSMAPLAIAGLVPVIPAVYALRRAPRMSGPRRIFQLWLIYMAYFLGRAASFGVVIQRTVRRPVIATQSPNPRTGN